MQVTRNATTVACTNMSLFFSSYEKSEGRLLLLVLVQMFNGVKANISGILLAFLTLAIKTERRRKKTGQHQYQKSKIFSRNLTNFHLYLGHMVTSGWRVDEERRQGTN